MSMHEVLIELVVVMGASVLAALLLRRLRLPPVVGFILAGVLVGPNGLSLVTDRHTIEGVAEVGVMLLLFTVGLKLKLGDLWRMRATVFGAGTAQVVMTGVTVTALAAFLGRPPNEAAVWGMVIALSSTALVLWLLEGSGQTSGPQGRGMVGILLLQDLAVVPIMLALPLLAGHQGDAGEVAWFLARAVVVLVLTVAGARIVFPFLAARVVAAGSRELFTLTTVLVAVGTALLFGHFGMSMALGAFFAGIVVSESEFMTRMVQDVTPLRDVFNSVFFVSLGMLVEPGVWIQRPWVTAAMVLAAIGGKALLTGAAMWPLARSPWIAASVGLGLAQVGEFSVVVAAEAGRLGVFPEPSREVFLAVAVPTMLLTPGLTALGQRCASRARVDVTGVDLDGHLVLVGYGVNGRNVQRALRMLDVPHVVVDLNPHTVHELQESGEEAVYGNAEEESVLRAAGVERARGVIVAIPDAASTREVVAASRRIAPETTIIARTRFVREVEPLESLGAQQVVPEEFETSLELVGRVLEMYGTPQSVILEEKTALRRSHYGALRSGQTGEELPALEQLRAQLRLVEIPVEAGSGADGSTLRELDLRRSTGATILAVRCDQDVRTNPSSDTRLEGGHCLVAVADAESEARVRALTQAPTSG